MGRARRTPQKSNPPGSIVERVQFSLREALGAGPEKAAENRAGYLTPLPAVPAQ